MPSVLFNLKQCFYFYVELFLFEDTFWSGFKDFSFTFTNGASGEEKLRGLLFFFFVKTETEGQSYGTSWRSVFPTVLEILFRVLWAFTAATDCHSGTLIMLHSRLGSTSWFLGEKVNIETYVFIPGGDWIVESGLWQQVDVRPMYCTTDELNEQPKEWITCNAVLS